MASAEASRGDAHWFRAASSDQEKQPMQVAGSGLGIDREQFYWSLAHEASDAVIFAGKGGMIQFWNRGAERIFGFSQAEAIGNSLDIIIPKTLRDRHWDAFGETMRTGRTRYAEGDVLAVPALRKDGSRISIEFTILPFAGADGGLTGVVAIVRDVTKRFEELKALRQEVAALKAAAGQRLSSD
jgi:PAS domain S-box-containing protein